MVAPRRRLVAAVATGAGAAVSGNPVAKLRVRSDKMSARIRRNPILIDPFAIDHMSHALSPQDRYNSYQKPPTRKTWFQRAVLNFQSRSTLTPASRLCDK